MSAVAASGDLQELFSCHLRTRLMLRDVMAAERDILARIVEKLEEVPATAREGVMAACIAQAAEGLVYE